MPSPFQDAAAAASAAVDAWYGEAFTLQPRARTGGDVNGRAAAVGAAVAFTGVLVAEGRSMHAEGRAKAQSTTMEVGAAPPYVNAPSAAFAVRPEIGWHVTRTATGERFRIASPPLDRGRVRIVLPLERMTP